MHNVCKVGLGRAAVRCTDVTGLSHAVLSWICRAWRYAVLLQSVASVCRSTKEAVRCTLKSIRGKQFKSSRL